MHETMKRIGKASTVATTLLLSAAAWAGNANVPDPAGKVVDPAASWDKQWHNVIVDITIVGVIFALVTAWIIWKARRRPGNEVGQEVKLSPASAVGWVVIPVFVFLSIDLYTAANGWVLWNEYRDVPADRLEIKLESGMYSWDYTYPNGVRTQNELIVPAGKPVLLRMTSRDTLHSHYIPDFRVKEDSMPGRITYLWFNPKKPGEHVVTCAEYCGIMHGYMAGRLIIKAPEEYAAWMRDEETRLAAATAPAAPADKPAGKKIKKT